MTPAAPAMKHRQLHIYVSEPWPEQIMKPRMGMKWVTGNATELWTRTHWQCGAPKYMPMHMIVRLLPRHYGVTGKIKWREFGTPPPSDSPFNQVGPIRLILGCLTLFQHGTFGGPFQM